VRADREVVLRDGLGQIIASAIQRDPIPSSSVRDTYPVTISFRRLRYFLFVASELHYGRAAEKLHVAQPALSQQIQILEKEVKAVLFERNRRRVGLTPAGEVLLEHAKRIFDVVDIAVAATQRAGCSQQSTLRVAYTRSAVQQTPSAVVERFKETHPNVRIDLRSGWTSLNVEDLLRGRLDVAFVRPPVRGMVGPIRLFELCREDLVLALPTDHDLAQLDNVPISALRHYPLVLRPDQYDMLKSELWVEGPPQRSSEEPDEEHALMAVAKGQGVFVLPEAIARILRVDGVIVKPFASPRPTVPLLVAYNEEAGTPDVANFLAIAREMKSIGESLR
jgi:DNA-binding transcriptional LysR family regulator